MAAPYLRDYKEPCPLCSEVNWGISDEGKFYCKSCHTVIEKTKEVDESDVFLFNAKVQSVSRGLRKERKVKGWEWYVCEGFQFILLKQAEALQALGVDPKIKDEVLWCFWRRYLHKTQQAYCNKAVTRSRRSSMVSQSSADSLILDSGPEIFSSDFYSDTDHEPLPNSGFSTGDETLATELSDSAHSISALSFGSGSVDATLFKKKLPWKKRMSMPMTLAFCYLSLLWLRESMTLSELLRLVLNRQIPYFNPEQYFPEQMKIYGADVPIFQVQSFPEHRHIMELTKVLGTLLDLPSFPPITVMCYYHPNVLCMKYLMEVNLPDELLNWTSRVARKTGLDDVAVLTYDPVRKRARLIPYDIQAAAIIIIVLKLIFALNDQWEWQMSKVAREINKNSEVPVFDFKKWYETIRPCVEEEQQKIVGMTKNLQRLFSKLGDAPPDAGNAGPSSFLFNWEEQNTSKIFFHGHSLEGITQRENNQLLGLKTHYWFNSLKCSSRFCNHWKTYDKTNFPATYDFALTLFSLVLGVEACLIHYEIVLIEEKLFKVFLNKKPKIK
ncbi:TATA box-binding protein-associated factor RNA polymerase I subunit B [Gastrophryne carolinensis]